MTSAGSWSCEVAGPRALTMIMYQIRCAHSLHLVASVRENGHTDHMHAKVIRNNKAPHMRAYMF